ncbi:Cyclin domain-containing protein [Aphelenchoides bicaudatus]|nr:Cyclin domain-containing protein [Aphelenchoides bicaudatus]
MYPTSTQKRFWTFSSVDDLLVQRRHANEEYEKKLSPGKKDSDFMTVEDETTLLKIVTETGIRFGEDFTPHMWPAVKWTAFAYFKRFYLRHSPLEFAPKIIIIACYYLAMKVEEFNVSIHDFTKNLKTGTPQSNAEKILQWEPILIHRLNFNLTIHCPFRPFEGHIMMLKTHGMLGFDLEGIRPHTDSFFNKCLFGDVMLLYPPTQIALAALSYGLEKMGKMKDIFREHILRLCQVDSYRPNVENATMADKLMLRVEQIRELVEAQSNKPVTAEDRAQMQEKSGRFQLMYERLTQGSRPPIPIVDSDDE